MKFRDPQEMMEIARLKALISEMREKGAKMEAELKLAASTHHKSDTWNQTKYQDEQKSMARQSEMLDEKIRDLQGRIDALRILVDQLVQEVSKQHDLEKDLDSEKTMIKELEDEIDANADLARAQLLSVERQLNDLKKSIAMVSQREKTYDNLLQKVGDLETEVARLRRENNEALHHNKALEERIHEAKKRTQDLASRTVEDVIPEILELRSIHCDLNKMVESLHDSRLNEAEEILYLKWVNTCLCHNLETYKASSTDSDYRQNNSSKVVLSRKYVAKKASSNDLLNPKNKMGLLRRSWSFKGKPSLFADADSTSHASARLDSLGRNNKFASSSRYSYGDISYTKVMSNECLDGDRKVKFDHPEVVSRLNIQASSDGFLSQSSRYYGSIDNMWDTPPFHEETSLIVSPSTSQRDSVEESLIHSGKSHLRSSWKRTMKKFLSMGSYFEAPITPTTQLEKMIQKDDEGRTSRISTEIFSSSKTSPTRNMKTKSQRGNPLSSSTPLMKHLESSEMLMSKEYLESVNSGYESTTNAYELRESEILPISIATHEAPSPVDHDPLSIKEQVDGSYKLTSAFKIFSKLTQENTSILDVDYPSKKKHDHGEEESVNTLALEWYESSGKANTNDSLVQASSIGSTLTQHSQPSTSSTSSAFVRDLAMSVQTTNYKCIEDVAAFIDWLDKQPDKEEFFSCKDWPTKRVYAMRWSGSEFENLKALESEINLCFKDEPGFSPDVILEHMWNVQKKAQKYIHDFTEAREWIISQLQKLNLPTEWMLDSGIIAKVKQGSHQLSQLCMNKAMQIHLQEEE